MVGQLMLSSGGRGKPERGRLYGLSVLRVETDPEGFWGEHRLKKALRGLRRGGALRVLAPREFDQWSALRAAGLTPVNTESFVRAQSAPLALEALERRGLAPDRSTVALRGIRAGREMTRAAVELCPRVRRLVVAAPNGGRELAQWLRQEFGIPVLPEGEAGEVALRFQAECPAWEDTSLELYGPTPDLAGLTLCAPGLEAEDRDNLPLLSVLWEGGKLGQKDIKIT